GRRQRLLRAARRGVRRRRGTPRAQRRRAGRAPVRHPGRDRAHRTPARMSSGEEPGVSRDAALEVLAFLVTAARTQTEEAAEYGPMRPLMAARLLAQAMTREMTGTAGDEGALRTLVDEVAALEPVRTPTRDREAYLASLDALCERVADALLAHEGRS